MHSQHLEQVQGTHIINSPIMMTMTNIMIDYYYGWIILFIVFCLLLELLIVSMLFTLQ